MFSHTYYLYGRMKYKIPVNPLPDQLSDFSQDFNFPFGKFISWAPLACGSSALSSRKAIFHILSEKVACFSIRTTLLTNEIPTSVLSACSMSVHLLVSKFHLCKLAPDSCQIIHIAIVHLGGLLKDHTTLHTHPHTHTHTRGT